MLAVASIVVATLVDVAVQAICLLPAISRVLAGLLSLPWRRSAFWCRLFVVHVLAVLAACPQAPRNAGK